MVKSIIERDPVKEHLSVEETAKAIGKSAFTIREHWRLGRLNATKKRNGRGRHFEWVITREELLRYQREGLLPIRTPC